MAVLVIYKLIPGLLLKIVQLFFDLGDKLQVEFVYIINNILCSEDLGLLDELVVVVHSFEEWLSLERHACEHATGAEYIELVVIVPHSYK